MIVSVASLVAAMALVAAPAAFAFGGEQHGGHHGPRNHHELSEHVERANLTERGYSYNNVRATWYSKFFVIFPSASLFSLSGGCLFDLRISFLFF